jgi:8-oxo-dGTP pyrophosphatase MutT (NUDIX family)
MASKNSLDSKTFNQDRVEGLRPGVVVCVINKEAKVLLCLKLEYKIWEFPQGGIEKKENLEDAIAREIKEELGQEFFESLFIPEKPLVAIDQIIFPEGCTEGRMFEVDGKKIPMAGKKYYFCAVAQTGQAEPSDKEYSEFRWVTFDEGNELVETINQKGKKRILKKALEILKEGDLII